jgi:patatin-like phospholipase/acyl hydrolase
MTLSESLGLRPKPYRILTIDGGGVRGIIPVLWLERLEQHLGAPVQKQFDLLAGTSVGAILACAFSHGLSARQVKELMSLAANTAFARPVTLRDHARRFAFHTGIGAKYDASGLIAMLKNIFGDARMGDLTRPTLALSYNAETMRVQVFSSENPDHARLPIWEVCRASSAAPLFFDPHMMVVDHSGKQYPMVDGGVTANNPVVVALSEAVNAARAAHRHQTAEHVVVASFGTGEPTEGRHTMPRTIFGHTSTILRAMITGATGTDHVTARTMLPANNYWRFQTSIPARLESLDGVENIDELQAIALAHLADGANQRLLQLSRRLRGLPLEPRWWEHAEAATG